MKGGKEAKSITLEEYAGFFHNPHLRHLLSHYQLNQIIVMHGFVKLHRWPKELILNAIESLDLMPPERSTVRERLKASVPLTMMSLEEAKQGIDALGWQECPLGSVLSFSAAGADVVETPSQTAPRARLNRPSAATARTGQQGKGGRRKRKRMKELALIDLPAALPM
ncbi:uncharacterized protein LOC122040227 [Zingiber officinale]|uniref:DUF7787 domain-containing protein n=1 Tax=Zingiber officinale TaxID=94328 RepID=A0A8J5I7P4_ZINOF|nr:uncharacterized protein LOC122040227 [Zingiber officinale]KAG6530062.1 hypothetical protein ZIOFF_012283 [Zingiber officinale]